MKVGDKVVCITIEINDVTKAYMGIGYRIPKVGVEYTVRGVQKFPHVSDAFILLEEIINPSKTPVAMAFYDFECGFNVKHFRKIDTHPELSELTDEMILTAPTTKELQTA